MWWNYPYLYIENLKKTPPSPPELPMFPTIISSIEEVFYPCHCTPEVEGVYCIIYNREALFSNLKPFPNSYIQRTLKGLENGLEGKIILNKNKNIKSTLSAIKSKQGKPDFTFLIFDKNQIGKGYLNRMLDILSLDLPNCAKFIKPRHIRNKHEFKQFEIKCLLEGYNGIYVRSEKGLYKSGICNLKDKSFLKLEPFKEDEGKIIGILNANNKFRGFLVRWKSIVITIENGIPNKIKKESKKEKYIDKKIKFRYLSSSALAESLQASFFLNIYT